MLFTWFNFFFIGSISFLLQPKCENYLPEDYKSCTFGKIEVKADSVIVKGGYTLRHLYLKVRHFNSWK